jgi:probable F420-dependent oxidoreductase
MKIGLFAANIGPCATPDALARVGRAAEDAGLESLWTGEHVVLPDPQVPPSPLPPDVPILDPAVALTFLAAHTTRVRLGTGIIILPQRNPLVLAKELASLDVLSQGRLAFGIGIGYLKPEFDALNVPFDHKGARTEEFLKAMLAIWTMEHPEFRGRFFAFSGVRAEPRPFQRPHPEIVFGGASPEAFRRAARLARGWYGFALDAERTRTCLDGLRAACRDIGRRFEDLEISVTPPPERERPLLDRDAARRFADLGVHRLIVYSPRARDTEAVLRVVGDAARDLVEKV